MGLSCTPDSPAHGALEVTMGRPNETSQAIPPGHRVRLQLSDDIYRAVRHRLVDAGPERSMSDIVAELISVGLAHTGGRS